MPLEIFALITPLGIALVVLIVRYSGLSKTARLKDRKNAIDLFRRDFAGENPSENVIISSDHNAAFVAMNGSNKLGLVEATGDRFITRLLDSKDIASFEHYGNNSLSIGFRDFTHPVGRYEFNNQQELSTVLEHLRKLEKHQ